MSLRLYGEVNELFEKAEKSGSFRNDAERLRSLQEKRKRDAQMAATAEAARESKARLASEAQEAKKKELLAGNRKKLRASSYNSLMAEAQDLDKSLLSSGMGRFSKQPERSKPKDLPSTKSIKERAGDQAQKPVKQLENRNISTKPKEAIVAARSGLGDKVSTSKLLHGTGSKGNERQNQAVPLDRYNSDKPKEHRPLTTSAVKPKLPPEKPIPQAEIVRKELKADPIVQTRKPYAEKKAVEPVSNSDKPRERSFKPQPIPTKNKSKPHPIKNCTGTARNRKGREWSVHSSDDDFIADSDEEEDSGNNMSSQIWKIMGLDRKKYHARDYLSDDDDMEASAAVISREDRLAEKQARVEDEAELAAEMRHQQEKKRRLKQKR